MNVGISTRCFGATAVTVDSLERVRRAGFEQIEIHANPFEFDFHDKSLIRSVGQWFGENGLPAPTVHLPFEEKWDGRNIRPLSIASSLAADRQHAVDEMKRCLELSDRIPIVYAVMHIGVPGQQFNPTAFDYAYAAIAALQSFSGVRIILENIRNDISVVDRLVEFLSVTGLANSGICYDTGHGELWPSASALDKIAAMHLNDGTGAGNGSADEHLWPFEGTADWPRFAEMFTTSQFAGPLVLEAMDRKLEKALDSRSRLRDLIDEARNSIEEFRLKYKLPSLTREEDE